MLHSKKSSNFAKICSKAKNMLINIVGYGKMGHVVERIAKERGHQIGVIIDLNNASDIDSDKFRSADVVIEFSTPHTAKENIMSVWQQGLPIVSGTTGWDIEQLKFDFPQPRQSLLWSSNFSIGVNLFFELNKRMAELIKPYKQYTASITEIHHIHKLDAPSGTAKTMAQDIAPILGYQPQIESIREGEVPGTHTITYNSSVDTLTIRHEAKSRDGFALGAVIAAEWLVNQPTDYYSMQDMLNIR